MPLSQKKKIEFFTWNSVFQCILSGTFCLCPCQKNVEFSTWSDDLVDTEDVLFGNSEYSVRIMGLLSFLLHSNASNLMFEILKHDKIWGQFALRPPSPNYVGEDSSPCLPRDLRPWLFLERWQGDGVADTVENSSVFTLIRFR